MLSNLSSDYHSKSTLSFKSTAVLFHFQILNFVERFQVKLLPSKRNKASRNPTLVTPTSLRKAIQTYEFPKARSQEK
ncbi:hypothetical protein K3495_g4985 [Podosphaera aphanis]|nr:hypothetical protein K3495_g4985 [Podosphaera aphanis]